MPQEWILRHVFDFSEGDAAFMIEKKKEETRQEQLDMAEIQQEIADRYPAAATNMEGMGESVHQRTSAGLAEARGRRGDEDIVKTIKRLVRQVEKLEKREKRIEEGIGKVRRLVGKKQSHLFEQNSKEDIKK